MPMGMVPLLVDYPRFLSDSTTAVKQIGLLNFRGRAGSFTRLTILARFLSLAKKRKSSSSLSFRLIVEGKSNREIAVAVFLMANGCRHGCLRFSFRAQTC